MSALYLSLALALASVVAGQSCGTVGQLSASNGPCSTTIGTTTYTYQGMQGFGQIPGSFVDSTGNTLRALTRRALTLQFRRRRLGDLDRARLVGP